MKGALGTNGLKLRPIQIEDPKYPLHAVHFFFLECHSPKAQLIHFREYLNQIVFNTC